MHVHDLTDAVLIRELIRRYPPMWAPTKVIRDTGYKESVIPAGRDNCVYVTFDPDALEHLMPPASER